MSYFLYWAPVSNLEILITPNVWKKSLKIFREETTSSFWWRVLNPVLPDLVFPSKKMEKLGLFLCFSSDFWWETSQLPSLKLTALAPENGWLEAYFPFGARPIFRKTNRCGSEKSRQLLGWGSKQPILTWKKFGLFLCFSPDFDEKHPNFTPWKKHLSHLKNGWLED